MVRPRADSAILVPVAESVSPTNPTTSPAPARRRPFGLYVVAALRLLHAAQLALIGLGLGNFGIRTIPFAEVTDNSVLRTFYLASALIIVIGIVGLLAMRRWGWVLTMLLVGFGLMYELVQVYRGRPDDLALLTLVIAAFYLNQRSVRALAIDTGLAEPGEHEAAPPVEAR
jgi:hypothetical protein